MYIIRAAIKNDCTQMLTLVKELALYEKAPNEVSVSLTHFEESGFGSNPVYWAFVAEFEGKVIAMALYYIRYSTWKGQRMYLEDIIVTEQHRNKGVGKLLMNKLIEEAKEKQLHGISWQVLDWNEPAIAFYKQYETTFDETWLNAAINV
jgi:GNAT superfamily N-acetyltransferase